MPRCGRGQESPLQLTFEVREAVVMDGDLGENEKKKKLKVEPKWRDCGVGFGDILTVDFWCSNLFFLSRVMSAIPTSHIPVHVCHEIPQAVTHYVCSLQQWCEHQGPRPTLGHCIFVSFLSSLSP
jgi:hypothetical protein